MICLALAGCRLRGPSVVVILPKVESRDSEVVCDLFEPLLAKLGNRLTVRREGTAVRWAYDGRTALVELRSDGALEATFIDRAVVDHVSASLAAPIYRRSGQRYALDAGGCNRMSADLVDFFLGMREPRFTFVGAAATQRHPAPAP